MGRPASVIEDYREWERRLERYRSNEANLDVFCLQEGVSRSTFYRWRRRLDQGIPESLQADSAEPEQNGSTDSLFLPISLKKSRVEIELPNGGVVRLPADVGSGVLTAVVRVVGCLRPWKAPQS
jgi:transposase-like protein